MSAAGSTGAALPTPDAVASPAINMSGTSGRVALVNGTTALVACPTATVVDLVGFGTSVCFETAATPVLSNTTAALRNNNGCTDTDDNSSDFTVDVPAPINSASTPNICGTSSAPAITATALASFGNVCTGNTAGPNSFTINGTNLTNANITVGTLTGYTFSTTSGGTYTNSLTLTQPGGTYSQSIFVKFSPVAVQSYNGNIAVNGGGIASAVNVAASGAGVNTSTAVTSGAASAITYNSATVAGSIPTTGCTPITSYGIAYSTTSGFVTGTQVPSTNLSGGNFTSALSGLAASTTYYYKAYAIDGSGTIYGSELSFTTAAPPITLTATTLTAFGNACINTTTNANSFTINGSNLTSANITVGPLAGYLFSTTSSGAYSASLTLTQAGGTYSQTVYVKFSPALAQSYYGNIPVSGGGATAINVAASGTGVNTPATVVTGAASELTTNSASLLGSINSIGCSNVTSYGFEYSGINGFVNAAGTQVPATPAAVAFSAKLNGLVQGATYYYKAYVVNSGGISYGPQQTFTLPSIGNGFTIYPVPAERNRTVRVTMNNLTPGYYGLLFYNSSGQLAYQKDINIQANFINQDILVPGKLARGTYRVQLINNLNVLAAKTILVMGY